MSARASQRKGHRSRRAAAPGLTREDAVPQHAALAGWRRGSSYTLDSRLLVALRWPFRRTAVG